MSPPSSIDSLEETQPQDPTGVYVLPQRSLAACLVASLAVFFAVGDPLGDPFDLDESVMWSYYAAPLCVAVALVAHARLRVSAWLLNTLFVGLVKFALTYVVATSLWAASAPLPAAPWESKPGPRGEKSPPRILQPPTPTPLAKADTITVVGVVRDAAGSPAPGALVWVHEGLSEFVFAPPSSPVRVALSHDHQTPLNVVQTYQPVEFVSDGLALHSVRGLAAEGVLFHKAVLAGGAPAGVVFETPHGWLDIRCAVHADAPLVRLLSLDHPAWAWTDPAGRFEIPGVPRTALALRARGAGPGPLSVFRSDTESGVLSPSDSDLHPPGSGAMR